MRINDRIALLNLAADFGLGVIAVAFSITCAWYRAPEFGLSAITFAILRNYR